MSKATIWAKLKLAGLSDVAVAGIMGNMEAESNCEACRVQGDFTATRTISKVYAEKFNTYPSDCFFDAKGFGLCQWTYHTRKEDLYQYCHDRGVGVEDEAAQVEFFLHEIKRDYPAAYGRVQAAQDIRTAAGIICTEYERPAVNNIDARAKYGQQIYNEFHASPTATDDDWIRDGIEYWEGVKSEIQAKIDDLRGRLK